MDDELYRRIKQLEERVSNLEKDRLYTYVNAYTRGCVCPAGAEYGCAAAGCPRRAIPNPSCY